MAAIKMEREQINLLLGGIQVAALEVEADFIVQHRARRVRQAFVGHLLSNDVFENVNKRELEVGTVNMAALIYLVDKYGL